MRIREIMTPNPEVLPMDASLMDAALKMRDLDVGAMPVTSGGSVVGIVTDRDIVLRGMAQRRDPAGTRVKDIMSRDVLTCPEDTSLEDAARIMEEKKVRRVLVTDSSGRTVGILSLGDIATKGVREQKIGLGGEILSRVSQPSRPLHH
ncbi:MAG: CBS domain-containing protein [Desulfomonilia bacterium]|jgi:CBS domain-containing protein